VSPRERIAVKQYVLLEPGISTRDAATLEDRAASQGLSGLVTPIGGLATYPSMVLTGASAQASLAAVAHEWIHAYFFFQPLGRQYWSDQEMRTINETAAALAGNELGAALARQLKLESPETANRREAPAGRPRQSVFSRLMRETRLEVDRLLALGQVDEAERYMEQRRLEINAQGYSLRKLNQAYFAFHGSYAESPAGSSPVAAQVRSLRRQSESLGEFLRAIAQVSSASELRALAGQS
jgi:hypothetical protein